MKASYRQKEVGKRKLIAEWIVSGKVTFLWGTEGVCRADYLISADHVIPDSRLCITGRG